LVADGIGVVVASRILGEVISNRLPGIEIGESSYEEGRRKKVAILFLRRKEESSI
jgi:UDP-N-acetyl-D-mannosaminuronic acid transferase (WecB/TagA/CpsF family)